MCRNIKPLFNFDPLTTDEEIREASLQFVRKISGMNKPSVVNEVVFDRAVDKLETVTKELIENLTTNADPRDREVEAEKHRVRVARRFGAAK